MFDKMIGFIGAGNMGSAIIGGILDSSLATTSQIIASAHSTATLEKIRNKFAIETTPDNTKVAEQADILFLAVKPDKFDEVIPQIRDHVKSDCVIVSIAAGKTIRAIEDAFDRPIKLVRAMPNTPALVGEAMSALCKNETIRCFRFFPCLCLSVYRGYGGCCCCRWHATCTGIQICGAVSPWFCKNGIGDGKTSWRIKRCRLLPWRNHD